MNIPSNSLTGKLFVANAFIILAALAVAGFNGYIQAQRSIDTAVKSHALGVLGERRARIEAWHNEVRRDFNMFTSLPAISKSELKSLLDAHLNSNRSLLYCTVLDSDGSIVTDAGRYSELVEVEDLPAVRSAQTGLFTVGAIHLSSSSESIINIAAPIQADSSFTYLCQMLVSTSIEPILADSVGLGYSGEAFLVGIDTVMLTPSRFHVHPDPLTHKMPIPSVLKALNGESGVEVYHNFLGHQVVGAYEFLPDFNWVLITEMITEEAFAPLKMIARNTIIAAVIALLFLLIFALLISRTLTAPIERLADASLKVADGNFAVQVNEDERTDEIGTLTSQFNRMVLSIGDSREKLKQSHARLAQAQKMAAIGELASGIVHEMRNPLSVIKMNLRLLQRKPDHDPDRDPIVSEQIELATQEANRLEKMLSELLDYSKPVELNYVKVPITEVARRAVESISSISEESDVVIEIHFNTTEGSYIWADKELLTRVLSNLLLNSIQASASGSVVSLKFADYSEGVQIDVIDKGRGMNKIVVERLFDTFFTTRENGVGLGMSNVKKIVEAHGGTIEVHSEENIGTTVTILFPKEN